ncbi:MAG: hypothetical protein AAFX93_18570 [Verrucomicrobiota bacterium]
MNKDIVTRGGESVPVKLDNGEMEDVVVSELPPRRVANEFIPNLQVESKIIELTTGKSVEWLDELSAESFMDLFEKGVELNFTQAELILKRRAESKVNLGKLVPSNIREAMRMLTSFAPTAASSSDSPPATSPQT